MSATDTAPDIVARVAEAAADRGPSVSKMWSGLPADAPALVHEDRVLTFGEVGERAARLAGGLSALGIGEGDRVALWLPNWPEYLEAFLACCRLGAIAVAVNTRFRSVEVGDIVGRSGARVLFCAPGFKGIDFAGILRGVAPEALSGLEAVVGVGAGPEPFGDARTLAYEALLAAEPAPDRGRPDSPAKIFTTSGTTSKPKFVLHNQGTCTRHGRDVARALGYDAPDAVLLQAVPFCGVFGFAQIMAGLAAGRPSVLLPVFDAGAAVAVMRKHRVTHTNGADDMVDRLLREGLEGCRLRFIGYAKFNPALSDLVERAEAAGVSVVGVYGMSECMALFSLQPRGADVGRRKLGGGLPVSAEAEIRVRDTGDGRLLEPGENGELEIRAPSLMAGYFGNDAATRKTFTQDGFLRTGDLATLTGDGGFTFLDRMGDALRLGGFLVNPQEIESHIATHPAVDACQTVGVTDGNTQRAVAFVTLAEGAEAAPADILAHCEGQLAKYKVPARVIVLEAFPVTESANGVKIRRSELRARAQEEIGGGNG